jgi:formylglycine-generating enzyme required for sulfatase activity
VIQFFDGVEMVKVPAGCFMMGSTAEEIDAVFQQCEAHRGSGNCLREWFNEEQPRHRVCFSEPFWIDRTEVTNAQFAQFGGQAATASNRTNADRPRERIAWLEAQSFCERRGARLPTEAEWEYAARGPDGLTYPWGNTFVAANAVYEENARLQTAAVGSRPDGVSWVGALDMSGNVWEWVNDWHGTYGTGAADNPAGPATGRYRVLRGGSWIDNPSFLRVANRWLDPGSGSNIIGIRCARSF